MYTVTPPRPPRSGFPHAARSKKFPRRDLGGALRDVIRSFWQYLHRGHGQRGQAGQSTAVHNILHSKEDSQSVVHVPVHSPRRACPVIPCKGCCT
ncbi:hypothetical protein E2C01_030884 [Portunus trituberculatus]|uniref:Uncharacterized protein n=1 Tax=Portunus trituberculatus TaxID=210409 RepID=A0A5B7EW37_PORTR|nr:hypothetical protein [Portunus trituberculatus]